MPMDSWRRFMHTLRSRFTPEERTIFGVQLSLLFVLSTLMYLGFPGLRERREAAEAHQLQTIIRGWDGLAWYVWLVAAPPMLWLIRRHPLGRRQLWQNLGRLALGSLLLCLAITHARYLLRVLPGLSAGEPLADYFNREAYLYNTYSLWPLDLLTYCGFFAVSLSIDYYYKQRRQSEQTVQLQLKAAQLQSELARAELASLRNQLHPHFLFNSFNALATLVRQRKNEAAVDAISKLSTLLRIAIERTGQREIPLAQEMDFIRCYLEIERLRFGDKLQVNYVLEPDTHAVLVPHIVLQPLVENAIKHGISLRTTPGSVQIAVARAGARLHIAVTDDGPDEAPGEGQGMGIGLKNVRAQLDKLYGEDYRLELHTQPQGGMQVRLDLPWKEALAPAIP